MVLQQMVGGMEKWSKSRRKNGIVKMGKAVLTGFFQFFNESWSFFSGFSQKTPVFDVKIGKVSRKCA